MALTQERNTPERIGQSRNVGVAAGVKIYAGALVMLTATGYATPAATATTLKQGGRASETIDNTGGAAGDLSINLDTGIYRFDNLAGDPITDADIGSDCYAVDDATVARTSGGNTRSIAGKIYDVDAVGVWVRIV